MRARDVVAVVIITLLLAALLDADSLVQRAESKPYGEARDRWLALWHPVQHASRTLRLDQPRRWIDAAIGRDDASPSAPSFVSSRPSSGETNDDDPPRLLFPTAVALPPTPTPTPAIRRPSPAAPLRLWVGGDSLSGIFGQSLVRMATDTGLISAQLDTRISTGLTRPDYFDWPTHLSQVMDQSSPEVVVLLLGGNDSQGIRTPGGDVYQPRTDGWRAEYLRRVAGTIALLRAPGRLVFWVGLPPMRDEDLSRRLADIDALYRWQTALSGAIYVDSAKLIGGANGGYAAHVQDADGHSELVREPDGVHLTRAGGDRVAAEVIRLLRQFVDLSRNPATPP